METKQTALQTLITWGDEMMKEHPMKTLSFAEAIDKAEELLEMEKEQIIDAYVECWKENMPDGYECKQSADEYYKETYGGKNE